MYLRTCVPAYLRQSVRVTPGAFAPPLHVKVKNTNVPAYVRTCVRAYVSTRSLSHPSMQVKKHAGTQVHRYASTQVRRYTSTQVHKYTGTQVHRYAGTQVRRYTGTQVHLCFSLLHSRYICISVSERPSPRSRFFVFSYFFVFFRVFRVPRVLRQLSVTFASITISLSAVYAAIRKVFLQQTPGPSCTPPLFFVPLHMRTNATTREGRCQYTQKGQSVRNKAPKRTHPITP